MIKTGIQLYSLRNEMADDFEGVIRNVSEMGYEGVEFAGLYGRTAQQVKDLCSGLGIEPVSAHVLHTELLNDMSLLPTYAEIGCKYMVIPFAAEPYRPGHEKFEEFLSDIRILGKQAKELGMKLCYHNHGFEFAKINGEYGLDIIFGEIPKDILETELDACWVKYMNEDPCRYIRKYADRTNIIHFKDFVVNEVNTGDKTEKILEYRPIGQGCQDVPALLSAAKDVCAEWIIVEQDDPTPGKTAYECVEDSVKYLKSIL